MRYHVVGNRIYLDRTEEEIAVLTRRLSRIEGQVRGIRKMIEEGRHCRDELQQITAVTAALKEIATIISAQHVEGGVTYAIESGDRETTLTDLLDLLKVAIRRD